MLNNWKTFPVSFTEGLITSESDLETGIKFPGSASVLKNLEVSQDGGYSKIRGYVKFDTTHVPTYGHVVVDGSGQTGTTLLVKGLSILPEINTTFTINNVAGTYKVNSVSFSLANRSAAITLDTSLASSPANGAVLTFENVETSLIEGVSILTDGSVVAKRGGSLYVSEGAGWVFVSKPSYGSVLVDGASQTGTVLSVKGIVKGQPQAGNLITVAGVNRVYTVLSATTVTAGKCDLTLDVSLASSPADEAAVNFISCGLQVSNDKMRSAVYRIGSQCEVAFVDGVNKPFKISCTDKTFVVFDNAPPEIVGATSIAFVRSTLFFGKSSILTFSAPADDTNFDTGDGAGLINVGDVIIGLIPFKNNLVIFGRNRIRILTGQSSQNFVLEAFTDKVGCVAADSISEVGGDVAYLSQEGVRFLSDTDRSGNFAVNVASRRIRKEITKLIGDYNSFQAVTIPSKSQYRIFGYATNLNSKFSEGFSGTQFTDQGQNDFRWSQLVGFKVRCAYSYTVPAGELIVFSNNDGFVYQMDVGNSFEGKNIPWAFNTHYISFTDPTVRKTVFKVNLYVRLKGNFQSTFSMNIDFNSISSVQPPALTLAAEEDSTSLFGNPNAIFGVSTFGSTPRTHFEILTTGAGNTFRFIFTGDDVFSNFTFDNLMIEFSEQGRQ